MDVICIIMSMKDKIINAISKHPQIFTLGISFGIVFAILIAQGTLESQIAHAIKPTNSIIVDICSEICLP
jgi:hypothetical protein